MISSRLPGRSRQAGQRPAAVVGRRLVLGRRCGLNYLSYIPEPIASQIGVGRDDGIQAGEFSPVFYKTYVPLYRHSIALFILDDRSGPSLTLSAGIPFGFRM